MTSKVVITGFIVMAFVAGSIMTGTMAFGAEKPNGDPFKAIWNAITGLQTNDSLLQAQIDEISTTDSVNLTDIENRLTALEENPVVKNTPPMITIENIVVSGYFEFDSIKSGLGTQCNVDYDYTTTDDGLMIPVIPQSGHRTVVIENPEWGSFSQEVGESAYDGIYRVFTSHTVTCHP